VSAPAPQRLAPWRVGLWIVLLLAAFGAVQYLRYGAWLYLGGAFAVIVLCAGGVLRQAWARQPLRLALLLVALWALASGGLMLAQWGQFDQARARALAQPQLAAPLLAMLEQIRRTWLLGLAFKALLLPLALWLAWRLGRPAVAAQFRARR